MSTMLEETDMGMYTELVLKCDVKKDLPPEAVMVLEHLFNNQAVDLNMVPLLTHPFFNCPRWPMIGRCNSYYHIPWATSRYAENYIFSRSDLKNYDNEIQQFIDWVKPYLDQFPGDCIGWSWYEEEQQPTLIIY